MGTYAGCSSKDKADAHASGTPTAAAAAQQGKGEAGEAYVHFEDTLAKAASMSEIKALLASSRVQELEQMGSQADGLLPALQAAQTKDAVVTGETMQGDRALLTLESKSAKSTGTATMVKEDGQWKLLEEEWEESAPEAGSTPAAE